MQKTVRRAQILWATDLGRGECSIQASDLQSGDGAGRGVERPGRGWFCRAVLSAREVWAAARALALSFGVT